MCILYIYIFIYLFITYIYIYLLYIFLYLFIYVIYVYIYIFIYLYTYVIYLCIYIYIDMSKCTYLQIPSSEPEPLESSLGGGSGFSIWEFPKLGVPYFGVLIKRILLFRVLH